MLEIRKLESGYGALRVLRDASIIAAEDTRITATLTSHYGIRARLASLHAHNERQRAEEVIAWLAANKRVALVTDAGTPAISDPGAALVRAVAALRLNPARDVRRLLITCLLRTGDRAGAEAEFRTVLAERPGEAANLRAWWASQTR